MDDRRKDVAIKRLLSKQDVFFLGIVEFKHKDIAERKIGFWWGHNNLGK